MSLKAKLEAVIYAAEEPVTLAQLAAIFAEEALAWKAERQSAASSAQEAEQPFPGESAELPLVLDSAPMTDPESPESGAAAPAVGKESPASVVGEIEPQSEPENALANASSAEETLGEAEPDAAAAEAELKRAVRQRDREVRAILREILDEIIGFSAAGDRGVEIREIAGGYRMATKPECHDAVRLFVKSLKPPLKLSLPALETLAVIAYKQPVTAPEVNEIRGVDSSGVFGSLLARKLISTAGRKQVVGRPILYKTTKEFLLRFGLKDVSELPSMEEFEKIAASELEDFEPIPAEAGAASRETSPSELDATTSESGAEVDGKTEGDGETEESTPAAGQDSGAESPQPQKESISTGNALGNAEAKAFSEFK